MLLMLEDWARILFEVWWWYLLSRLALVELGSDSSELSPELPELLNAEL